MNAFFAPFIRFSPRLLLVLCLPVAAIANDFFNEGNGYFDPFATGDAFGAPAASPDFQPPSLLATPRPTPVRPFPNLATDPVEKDSLLLTWEFEQTSNPMEYAHTASGITEKIEESQSIFRIETLYGIGAGSQLGVALPFQTDHTIKYSGAYTASTNTATYGERRTLVRDFSHSESSNLGLLGLDLSYQYQFRTLAPGDSAFKVETALGNAHYHSVENSQVIAAGEVIVPPGTIETGDPLEDVSSTDTASFATTTVSFQTPFIYDRFYRFTYSLNYEIEPRIETVWDLFYTAYEANDFYDLGTEMGLGVNVRYLWRNMRFIAHGRYIQKSNYTKQYQGNEVTHNDFAVVQYGVDAIYPFRNSEIALAYELSIVPEHTSTDGQYEFSANEHTRIGLSYRYYINLVAPMVLTEEVIENPTLDSLDNNFYSY